MCIQDQFADETDGRYGQQQKSLPERGRLIKTIEVSTRHQVLVCMP